MAVRVIKNLDDRNWYSPNSIVFIYFYVKNNGLPTGLRNSRSTSVSNVSSSDSLTEIVSKNVREFKNYVQMF